MTTNANNNNGAYVNKLKLSNPFNPWEEETKGYIMSRYQNCYIHLASGNIPVFKLEELDKYTPVARKEFATHIPTTAELLLPIVKDGDRCTSLHNHQDDDFFYMKTRNVKYPGESGKTLHGLAIKNISINQDRYENQEKLQCFSFLESAIDADIKRKIQVPRQDYDTLCQDADYFGLLKIIKKAHTGQGNHTNVNILIKMSRLSISSFNQDFIAYSKTFNEYEAEPHETADKTTFLADFCKTMFSLGLASAESNVIKLIMEGQYSSTDPWSSSIALQSRISTALTTLDGVHDATNGVIQSNCIRNNRNHKDNQPSSLLPTGNNTSNYTTSKESTTTTSMVCWNCGGRGHSLSACKQPPSTCTKCGGVHASICCDLIKEHIAKRKPSVKKIVKRFQSKKANVTNLSIYDPSRDSNDTVDTTIYLYMMNRNLHA